MSNDDKIAVESYSQSTEYVSSLRPLPDEIVALQDSETACQYCGVSYLLLTKYEKMETHVKAIQAKLDLYQVINSLNFSKK